MTDSRNLLGWLLVGLVGAVTAGAAILGVAQSPGTASLSQAMTNTLNASSYSEVFTETQQQVGSETGYLTYQAPDRLGGYVVVGANRRTYIFVQGPYEYQSLTVTGNTPPSRLVFYRQRTGVGVAHLDPAQNYINLGKHGHVTSHSGNTYTVSVTSGGTTGTITYTVTGQYIGRITIEAPGASVLVTISQVGTAPPVGLPAGAKVVTTLPSNGTGSTGAAGSSGSNSANGSSATG